MDTRDSEEPPIPVTPDSAPKSSQSRSSGDAEPKSTAVTRRRAAGPNPRSAASHFTRGETHRRLARYHAAILEYRKAVELAPDIPYYRYKLGDCYAAAGLGGNALKALEAARDLAPTDGFYHFWLGDAYARMGRPQEAMNAMQQATLYAPDDAYFSIRLGMVYYQACALQEAADAFRCAVALDPNNASYHCLLGDTYVRLGYEREALMHFRMAGRLDPYDAAYVERARRLVALEPVPIEPDMETE